MKREPPLVIVSAGAFLGDTAWADDCPNETSTNVPIVVEQSAEQKTCGRRIEIFGIGGSIIGESCPRWEIWIPAHAACQGEKSLGHA